MGQTEPNTAGSGEGKQLKSDLQIEWFLKLPIRPLGTVSVTA